MPGKVWGEIIYKFLNFNGCTIEVKEWISNYIPRFIMDIITYPCWDSNWIALQLLTSGTSFTNTDQLSSSMDKLLHAILSVG